MSLSVQERLRALADGKMIRKPYWDQECRTDGHRLYDGQVCDIFLSNSNRVDICLRS